MSTSCESNHYTTYTQTHLYIYIKRKNHLQTDYFSILKLFSVVRHRRRFKLGSKPSLLYASLRILPLSYFGELRLRGNYNTCCISFRLYTFCAIGYRSIYIYIYTITNYLSIYIYIYIYMCVCVYTYIIEQ